MPIWRKCNEKKYCCRSYRCR
ncbi:hypothetical protein ACIPF8_10225 [Collimonas sp. NPDC087041]